MGGRLHIALFGKSCIFRSPMVSLPPSAPSSPSDFDFSIKSSKLRFHRFPSIRSLFLTFLPVILWLFLFTSAVSLIPEDKRPPINVTLLPTIDNYVFGNSHTWFQNNASHPTLDLLAAVPYTVHPALPFAYLASAIPNPARRAALQRFVLTFGTMNLAAVCTHLAFPTAPPWYFLKYGFKEANYSMKGEPAILARVDKRFNIQMFHKMYAEGGKVVFGAWPSLHAAWPYLIARFKPPFGRKVSIFLWAYVALVWWAAIYLQHHFAADVLGGVLYAEASYWFVRFFMEPKAALKDSDLGLPFTIKQ